MLGYGINPSGLMTCVSIHQKIVIPTIIHGSEVWNFLSAAESEDKINRTQRRIVKIFRGFTLKRDLTFISGSCLLLNIETRYVNMGVK